MAAFESIGKTPWSRIGATEKLDLAIAELRKRGVKNDYCPRCETDDWNIDLLEIPANSELSPFSDAAMRGLSGLPFLPSSAKSTTPQRGTPSHLSLLAFVCKNCGNTIFHNLAILGLPTR